MISNFFSSSEQLKVQFQLSCRSKLTFPPLSLASPRCSSISSLGFQPARTSLLSLIYASISSGATPGSSTTRSWSRTRRATSPLPGHCAGRHEVRMDSYFFKNSPSDLTRMKSVISFKQNSVFFYKKPFSNYFLLKSIELTTKISIFFITSFKCIYCRYVARHCNITH